MSLMIRNIVKDGYDMNEIAWTIIKQAGTTVFMRTGTPEMYESGMVRWDRHGYDGTTTEREPGTQGSDVLYRYRHDQHAGKATVRIDLPAYETFDVWMAV